MITPFMHLLLGYFNNEIVAFIGFMDGSEQLENYRPAIACTPCLGRRHIAVPGG
jgi:hypothetical protein